MRPLPTVAFLLSLLITLPGLAQDAPTVTTKPAADKSASPKPAPTKESGKDNEDEGKETKDKEDVLAGHSYHGEAFNEGPRQKAYLMKGMPEIHFPVTTKIAAAQQFVEQGVGQIHGFWFFEAERSFRQAASLDPTCAMAYWGMAMANSGNQKRAKGFIAKAVERKDGTTDREKRYIDMLKAYLDGSDKKKRSEAYTKALEKLIYEYPEDLEAQALLALQLWKNRSSGLPIQSHLAVDALMQQVFLKQPMHPAHHYRIHLWDYQRAATALTSAAVCGQTAPGIAHMWHMPGHIYSRLKRYDDAAWQQEASARVDHAHMMRDRVLPDQISNFAHNNEWLIRNLNNVGRVQDATDLARNMIELPRHPKYNSLSRGSLNYGRRRLLKTLRRFEKWEKMIELADTHYLEPTDKDTEQLKRLRRLAEAHLRHGDAAAGERLLADARKQLKKVQAERDQAVAKAETKARDAAIDKAKVEAAVKAAVEKAAKEPVKAEVATSDPVKQEAPETKPIDESEKENADAKAKAAEAKAAEEKAAREAAAAKEKAVQEAAAKEKAELDALKAKVAKETTDKQIEAKKKQIKKATDNAAKPFASKLREREKAVWEIEGHQAALAGEPKKAYDLLRKAGGVDAMYLAKLQVLSGQTEEGLKAAEKFVSGHANEVHPLACQVDILWEAGKQDEAKKAFQALRKISASIDDLECPVFARLRPVVEALQWPTDWRIASVPATDIGQRPDLDSLGPFRWQPTAAPGWTLNDAAGQSRSLKQYQGRPVVAIFYLGYGCLHCVEQLHKFAPATKKFADQGIDLVAISSDDQGSLSKALKDFKEDGEFPFPLLANDSLDVFKAYRAYDDFEKQPLHGTFLIDQNGLVRWQDISYEPFMDVDFLLKESQRLMEQK